MSAAVELVPDICCSRAKSPAKCCQGNLKVACMNMLVRMTCQKHLLLFFLTLLSMIEVVVGHSNCVCKIWLQVCLCHQDISSIDKKDCEAKEKSEY